MTIKHQHFDYTITFVNSQRFGILIQKGICSQKPVLNVPLKISGIQK